MNAKSENKSATFYLPPYTKFAASPFVNAAYVQTITIYQLLDGGGLEQLYKFSGSGLNQTYLGTKVLESGRSGGILVQIEANGKLSSIRSVSIDDQSHYILLYSEDDTDNDYNDAIVLINYPLT